MPVANRRALAEHLSHNSSRYADPLTTIEWDALSIHDYWLPADAISLSGLAEFESLPEFQRKRLSQYEFISIIQAGVWLEQIFLKRLIEATRKENRTLAEHRYILHEIREEAGHSLMFLELMHRAKLAIPSIENQWPGLANFVGLHLPFNSALFWLVVTIGEEVPDKMNRFIRKESSSSVNPVIQQMCTRHIKDEARHIAFAREQLDRAMARTSRFSRYISQALINRIFNEFVTAFYLPHEKIYEYAGLSNGRLWRQRARCNPKRVHLVEKCVLPTMRQLQRYDIRLDLNSF
ncbi:MAG: diiron oxygenase [Gammaproteobacteria bacterium]|nr:diiron oxygenase [Gammaproteobacteria bacterium]